MTTLYVQAFVPLTGSGNLHFGDEPAAMVDFKLVIDGETMSGGGFLSGEKKFIRRAADASLARLEISPGHYLGLALGVHDDGTVPCAVVEPVSAPRRDGKDTRHGK
jgi:hypothetical protein